MSAIKAFFWNIGNGLNDDKIKVLGEAIEFLKPDVLTIAEGTSGRPDCEKLVTAVEAAGYETYYSPLFADRAELKLDYGYRPWGLKVFIKGGKGYSYESFADDLQREKGRIIRLRFFWEYKEANFVFIHNKAKGLDPTTINKQQTYLSSLAALIKNAIKPAIGDDAGPTTKDRAYIMGDFNLEPWESLLRFEDTLMTSFFENRNLKDQLNEKGLYFFNPLVKLIQTTDNKNLLGTYYNDGIGWALFDYILYPTVNSKVDFDVVTHLGPGLLLLNPDEKLKKGFLNHEFDHLPILANIE